MGEFTIPNGWRPRPHQMGLWAYLERGGKRAAVVWHRRSGKDSTSINFTATQAMQRVGSYWHMLPTQVQGRRVIWDGIDNQGRRIINQAFPPGIRRNINESEMQIELVNGSIWGVVGSDNYDRLVGTNPVGVIFSEYSLADPKSWDYLRPILAENGGWAVFIFTPRGRNHGYKLYQMAQGNPNWYADMLTVEDTGIISADVIVEERNSGMPEDMIQQEYFCSFQAGAAGSYYGVMMEAAEREGRICDLPYDPALKVDTWWDLGVGDSTVIWFAQNHMQGVRLIDHYENSGEGLKHYIDVLAKRGYTYGRHIAPHDIAVRELGSGKSRIETAQGLGLNFDVAANLPIDDGINAVRMLLPRCWFDRTKCQRGIDALLSYHKDWDDRLGNYRDRPVHDWSSDSADAFRMGAISSTIMSRQEFQIPDKYRRKQSTGASAWAA